MGVDEKLLEVAVELVNASHKELDKAMPKKLAGIVKLHAALGIGAAWIPVPGVDLAGGAAAIWGMYYRINGELKLPFSENLVKSVASGVGTNLTAYVGVVTVAQVLKCIPGVGTVAGAVVLSAAAYALTLASGYVYMIVLTLLLQQKNANDITESDFKCKVDQVMSDEQTIRSFFDEAKKSYKKENVASQLEGLAEPTGSDDRSTLPPPVHGIKPVDGRPPVRAIKSVDGRPPVRVINSLDGPQELSGSVSHQDRSLKSVADSMIRFRCIECGKWLKVPSGKEGRSGKCPSCGQKLIVPKTSRV